MWTFPAILTALFAAPLPEVRYEQLSCGLAVVLVEDHRLPLIAVESWFVIDESNITSIARQELLEAAKRRFHQGEQRLAAAGLRAGLEMTSESVRFHSMGPASRLREALDVELQRYAAPPEDVRLEPRRGVLVVIGSFDGAQTIDQANDALASLERVSRPTPPWGAPRRDAPAVWRRLADGRVEICFPAPPLGSARSARLRTLASLLAEPATDDNATSAVEDWRYTAGRDEGRLWVRVASRDRLVEALDRVLSEEIATLDLWRARRTALDAWRHERAGFESRSYHLARSQVLGDDLRVDGFAAQAIEGVRVDELRSGAADWRRELDDAVEHAPDQAKSLESRHRRQATVTGDFPLDRLRSIMEKPLRYSDVEEAADNPLFDFKSAAARRLEPHVTFMELETLSEICLAARLPVADGQTDVVVDAVRGALAAHSGRQLGRIAALRGHAWEVLEQGDHALLSVVTSPNEASAAGELLGRLSSELREAGYPASEFLIVGRLSESEARTCAAWLDEPGPLPATADRDAPRPPLIGFRHDLVENQRWRVELTAVDRRRWWPAEAPPWLVTISDSDGSESDTDDRAAELIVAAVQALEDLRRAEFSDVEQAALGRIVTSRLVTSLQDARSITAALARGWERPWGMNAREAGRNLAKEMAAARIIVRLSAEAFTLERAVRDRLSVE